MDAALGDRVLDCEQIKKAVQALLAYNKNRQKNDDKLFLNDDSHMFLNITVWKIPPREQVIKITLPHSILLGTSEICLFTKDEPGLTAEQTENFYKKLLFQHGITNITEVISYKTLKTEYKPFEAKRRLLSRFVLFLADDRIRRLLPSHLGKHFYKNKKAPLSVNVNAKDLAKEIKRHIEGTVLPITNKGCCYTVRIGHTGMEAFKIVQNVAAAVKIMATKAPQIWKSVKILHLKTDKSVALPIFTWSNLKSGDLQKGSDPEARQEAQAKKSKEKCADKKKSSGKAEVEVSNGPNPGSKQGEMEISVELPEGEEIPQLVPIERSPSVRAKVPEASPATREDVKAETKSKRKLPLTPRCSAPPQETPGDGQSGKRLRRSTKSGAGEQERLALGRCLHHPSSMVSANPKPGKTGTSAKDAPATPR
uniref:Ribosomal L1 domain-containing protein 1 n=1 Tax=Salvator merianae TaxID=96440 RepID=A0A8D0BBP7_SALMN